MDKKKFGKTIKLARIEMDLNQTQLAEQIGVSQKSISRWENGIAMPTINTLLEIVKVLDKTVGHFLD